MRREVGDQKGEATTLNNMGAVQRALDNMQEALDLYEQSLPIFRAVGDRSCIVVFFLFRCLQSE